MSARGDLADALGAVALFSRCTARARRTVARHTQIVALPAGAELVRRDEPGDALFVLLEGEVVVRTAGAVERVPSGSYFGELAVLDGGRQAASVVATTDVRVAVIGRRMFRMLLREYPELAEQLLADFAAELREARKAVDGH